MEKPDEDHLLFQLFTIKYTKFSPSHTIDRVNHKLLRIPWSQPLRMRYASHYEEIAEASSHAVYRLHRRTPSQLQWQLEKIWFFLLQQSECERNQIDIRRKTIRYAAFGCLRIGHWMTNSPNTDWTHDEFNMTQSMHFIAILDILLSEDLEFWALTVIKQKS